MKDYFITDFLNPYFQIGFKEYFKDLDITIKDWDSLFQKMNSEKENVAIIRVSDDHRVIGFIREFWTNSVYRNLGHGASLIAMTENYFLEHKVYKSILTTDTEADFHIKRGYIKDPSYYAKNKDDVYIKILDDFSEYN